MHRIVKRGGAAVVALALLAGGGRQALAHPPPLGTGLWWLPSAGGGGAGSGERLVVRTPRGFLFEAAPSTHDMRFLCNEAVGIQDGEDASLALAGGDDLLITTFANGIMHSALDACRWSGVTGVMATPAFDVTVVSSGSAWTAYVVSGTPNQGQHFWAGQNGNWSPMANSAYPYTRVRVAPSNPARVYLSGIAATAAGTAVHRLGVSNDGGKTVTDQLIALGPNDLQARVLEVDPARPDHVYVYVESNSAELPERILCSTDGGQSFTAGPTMRQIQGFAQSGDGTRVWVGGQEGLSRSTDGGATFSAPAGSAITYVSCLAFHGGRLYACGVLANQLVVAVSDDFGDSFTKIFSFDQVKQTPDCPAVDGGGAPGDVCAASLDHWRSELGTLDAGAGSPVDAGAPSPRGGAGGDPGVAPPAGGGASGCAVVAGAGGGDL
ncbi:MAG TPA: hypothetical protein VHO67_13205, partial [Polyangia bacterium]|nr:hypothetical protein [Polyangia bacterium]